MTQRKYYKMEGPKTREAVKKFQERFDKHRDARKAFIEKYECEVFIRGGYISGLAFNEPHPRQGFIVNSYQTDEHYFAKPDRRTKVGKQVAKDIEEFNYKYGYRHVSDWIVDHYKAYRLVAQSDSGSRTGMSMAVSVGAVRPGDIILLSVPVCSDEPFEVPEEGVEIPESEYIYLAKEKGNE